MIILGWGTQFFKMSFCLFIKSSIFSYSQTASLPFFQFLDTVTVTAHVTVTLHHD